MKKTVLSAKLNYLLDYAKRQYSQHRGLHLNSKDWESYVNVRSALYYSFLINGTIKFTTRSRISGKSYDQYVKLVDFKKFEPALLLLYLIDTPEDQIVNFIKTFLIHDEAKLFCTDSSFLYWGAKYNLTQIGSCYGPGEIRPPDIRDPGRNFLVCKHLWLVLVNFEKNINEFAKGLIPYYKTAFGLMSPKGLEKLKKQLGDKGIKNVIESALKNIDKIKSDEVKKLFRELTAGKLNDKIKEKFASTNQPQTAQPQEKTEEREIEEVTPEKENIPEIKEEKPAETPEENNNIEQENTNKEEEIL